MNPFEVIGTELPRYARGAADQQMSEFRSFADMFQPPQPTPMTSNPEMLLLYWRAIVDAMLRGSQGVPPAPQPALRAPPPMTLGGRRG